MSGMSAVAVYLGGSCLGSPGCWLPRSGVRRASWASVYMRAFPMIASIPATTCPLWPGVSLARTVPLSSTCARSPSLPSGLASLLDPACLPGVEPADDSPRTADTSGTYAGYPARAAGDNRSGLFRHFGKQGRLHRCRARRLRRADAGGPAAASSALRAAEVRARILGLRLHFGGSWAWSPCSFGGIAVRSVIAIARRQFFPSQGPTPAQEAAEATSSRWQA